MSKYLTPDQVRLREELAGARDRIVVLLRRAVGESLGAEQAQALVEQVRAWSGPNAFRLLRYLASRPDALSAPTPNCPACVVRLVPLLIAAGHGDKVALVPCADCGRTAPAPSYASPEGRVCYRCSGRRMAVPCARCGKLARPVTSRPEGRICQPCKNKEPGSQKECGRCRRMRVPSRHLPDGSYLCQTCAPKKLQKCCRCGRDRRVNAWTPDGPICAGCYSSPPRRCGVCGLDAPIAVRATGDSPDTCYRCQERPEKPCHVCGRVRPGQRIDHGNGPWHCDACVPREARKRVYHACALCGEEKSVRAFWPVGPVCGKCYRATRSAPGPCPTCGQQRILMGRGPDGEAICRGCSFPDEPPERCRTCHQPADLLPGRRCPRCTLRARVTDLLSPDGNTVPEPLRPLAAVLTGAPNPYPVLAWLRSPAARLLGSLILQPGALDHTSLDGLPQGRATDYARSLLVTTGMLPPRDENLALLVNWSARTLTKLPPHQAVLIRPFTEWHIIRDARRQSARHRYTYAAHKAHCSNIRAAINFLTWLDTRKLTLSTLQQHHLDTWATHKPTLRARSIRFIRWATARRLTSPGLSIAYPPSQMPGNFQTEDVHHEELRRCLNDTTLPMDVRVTAALIRLYALPLTRIVKLTADQLHHDGQHTFLTINRHPVVLPPKLADLINDQLQHTAPLHDTTATTRYLIPGYGPGRPRNPAGLAQKLHRHGLPARAARNTAVMEALADLPPQVISDLFGFGPKTAERWARFAAGNWSDYLAGPPAKQPHSATENGSFMQAQSPTVPECRLS